MVRASFILRNVVTEELLPRKYKGFVDNVKLRVRGGSGGMGFPKYGGIGGKGGDVVVEAKERSTLLYIMSKYPEGFIKAATGKDSHETCILGKPGKDQVIQVPVGVNIVDEKFNVLGELNRAGDTAVIAKGGVGGYSDTGFCGMKGEERIIHLDLKLIADIGFVGFPNAGKSTLLRAITRAKPKIASYPFTTLKPNIGIMQYPDARIISMADLPGLIEGAHKNLGMGYRFLRHCERTHMLLFMADIQGFQYDLDHSARSCLETVILLNRELELYRSQLLEKPAVLVINKMDVDGAWEEFRKIEGALRNMKETVRNVPDKIRPRRPVVFEEIIPISAKTSLADVRKLKEKLRYHVDQTVESKLEDVEIELREKLISLREEYKARYI